MARKAGGRKPRGRLYGRKTTPGEMYSSIETTIGDFEGEEEGHQRKKTDPFVKFCKDMHRRFPGFAKGKLPEGQRKAINFLGWGITGEDFNAAVKGAFVEAVIPVSIMIALTFVFGLGIEIGGFNPASLIGGALFPKMFGGMAMMFFMALSMVFILIPVMAIYMVYSYPLSAAEKEKNRALSYVPDIIGYMIMSMKLVPNLEKAIDFAAKHGKGKVASDFKRVIWDFQLGVYNSISEGLDDLAYRWGDHSTELKEALMRIRASVLEPEEGKRYQLLDKTMLNVLDSVKSKLEDYARGLNQPSVMLFYLGVLLPLILIIILPVGSAFSGAPLARPEILLIIYCAFIPGAAFMFAKNVVEKRPPTYEPPPIPENFEGLPPKWGMRVKRGVVDTRPILAIILVLGVIGSFALSTQGIPPKIIQPGERPEYLLPPDKDMGEMMDDRGRPKDYFGTPTFELYPFTYPIENIFYDLKEGSYYKRLTNQGMDEETAELMVFRDRILFVSSGNDPTKYLFWSGIVITLVMGASFLIYYRTIYRRKVQQEVMSMEDEFKESMYLIASRMGENKPVENALKHAKDFLPNLVISRRIFGKTLENIELMGMPLESAVFDPAYGAMKGIPSKILRTSMRLLVDSVSLGVDVASRTLISLSLQMENMDKVNKSLKDMVSEVATTMQTMALFIAPMVLGITTALQKVVMNTLAGVAADPALQKAETVSEATSSSQMDVGSLFSVEIEAFKAFASPLQFFIIISIYVVMIVVIMTYFTTKVQEDNNLLFRMNLAKSLPIAVIVYVLTVIGANLFIGMIL